MKGGILPRCRLLPRIYSDRAGAALVEFTLVLPFLLSIVFGMAEFGRFIYQYQLVLEGLRDAGRYLSRVDASNGTLQTNAINLAVTGTLDGTGAARVTGWATSDVTISFRDVDNSANPAPYRGPATIHVAIVTTTFDYADIGMLGALGLGPLSVRASYEQRVLGE
jgi:Flp pilus assembly protein TadG